MDKLFRGLVILVMTFLGGCAAQPLTIDQLVEREREEQEVLRRSLMPQLTQCLDETNAFVAQFNGKPVVTEVVDGKGEGVMVVTADGKKGMMIHPRITKVAVEMRSRTYEIVDRIAFHRTGIPDQPFAAEVRIASKSTSKVGEAAAPARPIEIPAGYRLRTEEDRIEWMAGFLEGPIISQGHGGSSKPTPLGFAIPIPRSVSVPDHARQIAEAATARCNEAAPQANTYYAPCHFRYNAKEGKWEAQRLNAPSWVQLP